MGAYINYDDDVLEDILVLLSLLLFVGFYHFIFIGTLAMSFPLSVFHGVFMRMRERQVISNSKKNEWNLINLFSTKLFLESLTIQISHLYAIGLYINIDYLPSCQALHNI